MGKSRTPARVAEIGSCDMLTVTATTPAGVIAAHPWWPLLLDGILAMVDRSVVHGVRPGARTGRHRAVLPLAAAHPDGQTRRWSWLASAGTWSPSAPVEPQPWGRRTDGPYHRAHGDGRRINTSTGPDKSLWSADEVTLAGRVTWRAVGVAAWVESWLAHIDSLGAKTRRGQGTVTRWQVHAEAVPSGWDGVELMSWVAEGDERRRVARPLHPDWAPLLLHEGDTVPGYWRPPYPAGVAAAAGRPVPLAVLAP